MTDYLFGVWMGIVIGALGFGFFLSSQEYNWTDKTIAKSNCAEYNKETGKFEWLDTNVIIYLEDKK
jgi:hypothetical protein